MDVEHGLRIIGAGALVTAASRGNGSALAADTTYSVDCLAVTHTPSTCLSTVSEAPRALPATSCSLTVAFRWLPAPPLPWLETVAVMSPFSFAPYAWRQAAAVSALAQSPGHRGTRVMGVLALPSMVEASQVAEALDSNRVAACGATATAGTDLWYPPTASWTVTVDNTATETWFLALGFTVGHVQGTAAALFNTTTQRLLQPAHAAWKHATRGVNATAMGRLSQLMWNASLLVVVAHDANATAAACLNLSSPVSSPVVVVHQLRDWLARASSSWSASDEQSFTPAPVSSCAVSSIRVSDAVQTLMATIDNGRRFIVSAALPPASLAIEMDSRPSLSAGEIVRVWCTVRGPAASMVQLSRTEATITASSWPSSHVVLSADVSSVGGGGVNLPAVVYGSVLCTRNTTAARSDLPLAYPVSSLWQVQVVVVQPVAHFFGDVLMTTRPGHLRSAWLTADTAIQGVALTANAAARRLQSSDLSLWALGDSDVSLLASKVSRLPPAAPFAPTVTDSVDVVVVADRSQRRAASLFPVNTTLFVNDVPVQSLSTSDGSALRARLPPRAAVCSATTCKSIQLTVRAPSVSLRELAEMAVSAPLESQVELDLVSRRRAISLAVSCPPFCPGTGALLPFDITATRSNVTLPGLQPAAVLDDLYRVWLVPHGTLSVVASPGGAGIRYRVPCTHPQFANVSFAACINASDAQSADCPLGG